MQTLRIGFIGAGANTRLHHLPKLGALPGVELAAVANRSPASGRAVAAEHGIARVASSWREIAGDPRIDAVCIGTWPHLHAAATLAALGAGKHVLTEARMACDADEAATMLAASRAAPGLVAQVVPSPFTLAFDDLVRGRFVQDALGPLRRADVVHTHGAFADPAAPVSWRQRSEFSGHNILSLGIHYETLVRWLDDDADVLRASGAIAVPQRPDADGRPCRVDLPDTLEVAARFRRSGAELAFRLSGIETGAPQNTMTLEGDGGSLRLDLAAGSLEFTPRGGAPARVPVPAAPGGGWRVEEDFIASIREGRPVTRTDFATGVRYMRFTDDVWRHLGAPGPA